MALGTKSERGNYGPRAWRKLRSRKIRRRRDKIEAKARA